MILLFLQLFWTFSLNEGRTGLARIVPSGEKPKDDPTKNDSMIDFLKLPSPCYVLDEKLLDANLGTIDRVRRESGPKLSWP